MTIAYPMFCSPVSLGASNKGVRISAPAAAATVNLVTAASPHYIETLAGASAAGTTCLLKILQDALNTHAGDANWVVGLNATGYVQIMNAASTWEIDCSHGDTTIPLTALGFNAATIGANANTYAAAPDLSAYRWVGSQPIVFDSFDQYEADTGQNDARSGALWTMSSSAAKKVRTVDIGHEPIYRAIPTTGYDNQDWNTSFWPTVRNGQTVRYYTDSTVATYGSFVLNKDTLNQAKEDRYSSGAALYSWRVGLRGFV